MYAMIFKTMQQILRWFFRVIQEEGYMYNTCAINLVQNNW